MAIADSEPWIHIDSLIWILDKQNIIQTLFYGLIYVFVLVFDGYNVEHGLAIREIQFVRISFKSVFHSDTFC